MSRLSCPQQEQQATSPTTKPRQGAPKALTRVTASRVLPNNNLKDILSTTKDTASHYFISTGFVFKNMKRCWIEVEKNAKVTPRGRVNLLVKKSRPKHQRTGSGSAKVKNRSYSADSPCWRCFLSLEIHPFVLFLFQLPHGCYLDRVNEKQVIPREDTLSKNMTKGPGLILP